MIMVAGGGLTAVLRTAFATALAATPRAVAEPLRRFAAAGFKSLKSKPVKKQNGRGFPRPMIHMVAGE
jgi:hypothetical protein